jgi:hypothetical protein
MPILPLAVGNVELSITYKITIATYSLYSRNSLKPAETKADLFTQQKKQSNTLYSFVYIFVMFT